jgi:hypothetical protein
MQTDDRTTLVRAAMTAVRDCADRMEDRAAGQLLRSLDTARTATEALRAEVSGAGRE